MNRNSAFGGKGQVTQHRVASGPERQVFVLVLNWNNWKDTNECLASLRDLDYNASNVIVLDNGSTDSSVHCIREKYPEVEIMELGKNFGFAKGNNAGIRAALRHDADYVWLLNNDTTVDSEALRAMVQVAESDPRIGAVGSVIYDMHAPHRMQAWGGGRISLWFGRSSQCTDKTSSDKLDYLTGASMLLRREALEDVGLLDEAFFMYWEDSDLCFRLRKAGWRLAVASKSEIRHKKSATSSRTSSTFDLYVWRSMVCFCKRHAAIPAIPIVIATVRMITKRGLRFQLARAIRLCQAIYAEVMHGQGAADIVPR